MKESKNYYLTGINSMISFNIFFPNFLSVFSLEFPEMVFKWKFTRFDKYLEFFLKKTDSDSQIWLKISIFIKFFFF